LNLGEQCNERPYGATLQNNTQNKAHIMKLFLTSILFGIFALVSPVVADEQKAAPKDIVDTAVAAGSFKTLAAALGAANLVEAMKGVGPFTVFAPTDEAFAKLPKGIVDDLLKPENKDKLVDILTYHVVSGKVMSKTAVTLEKATALNKKEISLAVVGKALTLNKSAKVVTADIECANGVIHVIDTVLLPPAK
jgi:uncharacterized surface protein with fasciclin (FAS1) repeats